MTYDDALEFLEEHPGYPPMHRFIVSIMDYLGFRHVGPGNLSGDLISRELAGAIRAFLEDRNNKESIARYKNALKKEMDEA